MLERAKQYTELWRESNALYEEWARKHGLSYCELLVLLSLDEGDGRGRQKEICRQWQLPKQTVNSILKGFADQGWVSLVPAEDDRRNKEIRLTPTGKERIRAVAGELQRCELEVWKRLGRERAVALVANTGLYNQLFREVGLNEDPENS